MSEQQFQLMCETCQKPYDVSDTVCPRCGIKATKAVKRPLLSIILDPKSIQMLLRTGGGLLVLGLVIWLAALGVFDNSLVLASCLGAGNLTLLLGGWALLHWTRHKTAGQALTLLACLVMPLNLWFYHAQALVTLQGHLWVAALVMCALYAASAFALRDSLFVYVLCGGLAMTGLLLLADLGRFEEIAAPSTLLIVLGLAALHVERAFPNGEGPFSRKQFGMAFVWSSQILISAGLLLLMGGQLTGWSPIHAKFGLARPVVADPDYFAWTFLLTLAATYAFLYASLVVRHVGCYFYVAMVAFAWAQLQVLFLWNVSERFFPLVFATTGLTLVVSSRWFNVAKTEGILAKALDCGHILLALALAAGGLLALSHVSLSDSDLLRLSTTDAWQQPLRSMLVVLFGLAGIGALGALATPSSGWRRGLFVLLCLEGILVFAILHRVSMLSPWQKVELFSVIAGLALLLAGHVGLYREGEGHSDLATFNLVVGGLLALVTLTIASMVHRFGYSISFFEEGILILISVLLLGSGILLRIKSNTILGAVALAVYIFQVLAWMGRFLDQQILIGVYLTIAGGLLFGTGLMLSLYRDRLLALPERIKNREGMFRILNWR